MEKAQSYDNYIDLEFIRLQNPSKEAKIKEFWKYIDEQDLIKPYQPKYATEEKSDKIYTRASKSSTDTSSMATLCATKSKPKLKKHAKEKKSGDQSCKLEKYFREELKLADTVEVSFDEINAEIEEFQKRLTKCNCKNTKCNCEKKK